MKSDLDALMQERELDALLVFGHAEHNPPMYYFCGGGHVSNALLIKQRGRAPVLFHNDMEREEAAKSGLQTRSFSDYDLEEFKKQAAGDLLLAGALRLQKMLSDLGIERGRLGVYGRTEFSAIFGLITRLQALRPEIEFVGEPETASLFMKAMETKGPSEVERIRRMGRITVEVVQRVAEYLTQREVRSDEVVLREDGQPLTIGDVKAKINLWIAERGAENPEGTIFAIGREAGLPHSTGRAGEPLRLGQTIVFDIFPCEAGGGYFYDFTRTWSLGYATPQARDLYQQVYEIYQQVRAALQPDTPFQEYQRRVCEYFEARGHPSPLHTKAPLEGYVHSLGHGVGLNIHERPFSGLHMEEHRLVPGAVFTLEPGLYYPERGLGVRIEDTCWLRPDGQVEFLAEYPYDLVLPMKRWKRG